eukprot:NODE_2939_length_2118_cov_10.368157.p1 GENE.NODE_2939_length_2118_cov_10.368157~~NODE_2939_length_2118_cov_10.368157.p1  ORF type:complete len:530 (+),score=112.58 NODE_2939_length_2118_cov_10.368157:136-1725(+)
MTVTSISATSSSEQTIVCLPDPVRLGRGRIMEFPEDALTISVKSIFSRTPVLTKHNWEDIEGVFVEWFCFTGKLIIKLNNGEDYSWKLWRSELIHAASAIHRGAKRKSQKKTQGSVETPGVDAKLRKLLLQDPNVGLSADGLMMKQRTSLFSGHIILASWHSIVSAKLTRNHCGGRISINAIDNHSEMKKVVPTRQVSVRATSGHNLLHHEDIDRVEFYDEQNRAVVEINTDPQNSDALFGNIQSVLCGGFDGTKPLTETLPICAKNIYATMLTAGLFAHMSSTCSCIESKVFVAWESIVCISYKAATCLKDSQLSIHDRSGSMPLVLRGVSEEEYESLKATYVALSGDAKGAELVSVRYCRRSMRDFVLWQSVAAVCYEQVGMSARVLYLTSSGSCLQLPVPNGRRDNAWQIFLDANLKKYPSTESKTGRSFGLSDNKKMGCFLTDQSLRLSLQKGAHVIELDLNFVIGARRGRCSHAELEVGVSLRGTWPDNVITVSLDKSDNARVIAQDVNDRVAKLKPKPMFGIL